MSKYQCISASLLVADFFSSNTHAIYNSTALIFPIQYASNALFRWSNCVLHLQFFLNHLFSSSSGLNMYKKWYFAIRYFTKRPQNFHLAPLFGLWLLIVVRFFAKCPRVFAYSPLIRIAVNIRVGPSTPPAWPPAAAVVPVGHWVRISSSHPPLAAASKRPAPYSFDSRT